MFVPQADEEEEQHDAGPSIQLCCISLIVVQVCGGETENKRRANV